MDLSQVSALISSLLLTVSMAVTSLTANLPSLPNVIPSKDGIQLTNSHSELDSRLRGDDNSEVLQAATSVKSLVINANVKINGELTVRDSVGDVSLEGNVDGNSLSLSSSENNTLTVTGDVSLDQDLLATSSPQFSSLTLSATTNQISFGGTGGGSGLFTFTPTGSLKTITFPDKSGEVTLLGQTIANDELVNSAVTITAGDGLATGGSVSLGGSVTLKITAGTGITVSDDSIATTLGTSISGSEIDADTVTASNLSSTLTFSDGDLINLAAINSSSTSEGLILPQATSCASATAEGQLCFDTDDDLLYTGSGSTAIVVGTGDITAVGSMTSGATFADSTADDDWLGLGAAAGRIAFDDLATDEVDILDATLDLNANLLTNIGNAATDFTSGGGLTLAGEFSQSGTGTFGTGTGAVSLNGATTIAANKNLSLSSGTGVFTQTFTGTATDALTVTAGSVTTGSSLVLTGPTSTGVTDHFVKITSDVGSAASLLSLSPDFSGSAVTAYGLNIAATDSTANGNTDYGVYSSLALTGNAAKTGVGMYSTVTSTSTTGDTLYGLDVLSDHNGASATGNKTIYGIRSQVTNDGVADAAGTHTIYGGYFDATGNTGGTQSVYGLYLADVSGGDTNVALCFDCDGTYSSSTVASGIQFGSDANSVSLYRSASDVLRTGDGFTVDLDLIVSGGDITGANGAVLDLGEATSGDITVTGDLITATTSWIGLGSAAGRIVFTDTTTDELDITNATIDMNANLLVNIGNAATDFNSNGGLTLNEDLTVNGGDIIAGAATMNLLDTVATTINFGSAATTFNINDAAVTSTIDIGGVTNSGTNTINIATEGTAADVISIGNSNASTTVAITGGNDWSVTATGVLTVASCTGCGGAFTNGQQTVSPTVTGPIANLTNDVTPIAAGATGTYSTLTYLPQALYTQSTASYNGYLFTVGGSTGGDVSQSTVYSTQLKADGTTGTYSTLTYLPKALGFGAATTYNGYLFVAGGHVTTDVDQSTVYSAPINSDGTIGSFSTLTYLPQAFGESSVIGYNGHLYVVGGCDRGCNDSLASQSTVYLAPINSDGTIGAFSTLTYLPQALKNHSTIVYNGYLFVTGGCSSSNIVTRCGAGTIKSTVYSAPINSDGTIGAFSTLTYLPQALAQHSISQYNGYLFVAGGCNINTCTGTADQQSTVYSAPINSDGTIGAFSTLTYIPQVLRDPSSIIYNGYLFVVGGSNTSAAATTQSTVYSTPLKSTALAVNTSSSFAQGNLLDLWNNTQSKFSVDYNGNVTTQGSYISDVVPKGDGATGSYATTTFLPATLTTRGRTSIAYNGYLYILGGSNDDAETGSRSTVWSAPIKSDGTIGAFSTLTYLPDRRYYHSATVYNGYLFVVGGLDVNNTLQSTVWSAPIKSDGTIGAFSTLTYLPDLRQRFDVTTYNGYLFVMGGYSSGTGTSQQSTVWSAPIKSDGTIGAFSTLTYLPDLRGDHSVSAHNGYLFVSGGTSGTTNPSSYHSTVWSAPIKSDGTIGAFSTLTYLPNVTYRHSTESYNGYLYVIGGSTPSQTARSTVYSAPIRADGTLGSFSTITYLQQQLAGSLSTIYNGYLFVMGGLNNSSVRQSTVYYASLTTSRAFVFNANSQTWPESTGLGGSAALFDIQNNGDAVATVNAQGDLLLRGKLSANSVVIGTDKPGDLAENFEAEDDVEPGDVVSIDKSLKSPKILKSLKPYEEAAIGVISSDPSITLSPGQRNGKPVALAGRVPVKVSLENGPIEVGDFLTSSSTPGVAMKASKPGQVIGKALEGFSCNSTPQVPGLTSGVIAEARSPDGGCTGKVQIFVNVTWADPSNFLANLSFDNDGTLIAPAIKTGSLTIDPSISVNLSSVSSTSQGGESSGLSSNSTSEVIAELEDRIAKLESLQDTLTNPDQLLASGSATLNNLSSLSNLSNLTVSEATISGLLSSYDLTISNIFKSLGKTILGATTIAGDLNIDTLLISQNSLNALTTLYLQNSPLSLGLDIFNGKVIIDNTGNINASSITVDQIKINSGKSAGSGTIPKDEVQVTINSEYTNENSLIFINSKTLLNQILAVAEKKKGSFTVKLSHPEPQDIFFSYFIIEER